MTRDEILEDFFRTLRVVLTNAFSYSKDHPYFIKSVANFKNKLDVTLSVISPLQIGITDMGLVADGRKLIKSGFYDDLARLLHQRKIKSLEIRKGVDLQELVQFFSIISMPQKEIFKSGGIGALLLRRQLRHFSVGELDYSSLLQGGGQECVDIWGYMLKDAVRNNDTAKLNKLADDFGQLFRRVNEKDVFGADGISAQVSDFLISLKSTDRGKFDRCTKDVFLWLLRNKKTLTEEKLAQIKPAFVGLSEDDFSTLLWEAILRENDFDALSLQIFSKISDSEDPGRIAGNLLKEGGQGKYLAGNPRAINKIRNLLSTAAEDPLSAVYRNTLESLVKGISFSGKLLFDHKGLLENYRNIALGMFSAGANNDNLRMIETVLEKELPKALEDNDTGFLKGLRAVLAKRRQQGLASPNLETKLSFFAENIVLNQGLSPEQEFLLEMVSAPSHEDKVYLDKIFNTPRPDKYILALFLRLFKNGLDAFYGRLQQKFQDMEFLLSLIATLGELSSPLTLDILEYIYSTSNQLVKLEVLEAMRRGNNIDAGFLMSQLKSDSLLLKKGALAALLLDPKAKEEALKLLFQVSSPWGRNNRVIIENMQLTYLLGLKEAASYISELSKRKFFWNRRLREKAAKILKEWNVG